MKSKQPIYTTAMLLLLSLFIAPALAIIPYAGNPLVIVFGVLDLDGTGELTKLEFVNFIEYLDRDYDGVVLLEELLIKFPIGGLIDPNQLYGFLDIDADTGIDLDDINLIFDKFDIDLNGKITLAEQLV